MVISVFS